MTILSAGISVIDPKGEKFRSTVLFAKPVPNEYFKKIKIINSNQERGAGVQRIPLGEMSIKN